MNTIKKTTANQDWNKSYMLGIQEIDEQHEKFFILFDRLNEMNKNDSSRIQILDVIEELTEYTHYHFGTEEKMMESADVEDFELHKMQHEMFVTKLVDFKIAYNYNNSVLLSQMVVFMRKWLLMHISETDRRYVEPVKTLLSKTKEEEILM